MWMHTPCSAGRFSYNSIFLSRQISQLASQPNSSIFLSDQINQPSSQPAEQGSPPASLGLA
jgi:hypothetical protein